jgi:uncharacterized protein (DUF433 family)
MALVSNPKLNIIQTERGSSIAGTRITLSDVLDYLKADYSHHDIAQKLGLTIEQIDFAIDYIAANHPQVEAEYQACLETAKEIRQYWEEHNRDRFARIAAISPTPEKATLRAKLTAWNDRINASV